MSRNIAGAVLLMLIGIGLVSAGGGLSILGILLIGFGVAVFIGNPAVTIVTAGGERRTSFGGFSQKQEAREFAQAVRKAVFDD